MTIPTVPDQNRNPQKVGPGSFVETHADSPRVGLKELSDRLQQLPGSVPGMVDKIMTPPEST